MSIVKNTSHHQVANTKQVLAGTYPKQIRKYGWIKKRINQGAELFFPVIIVLITGLLAYLNHVPNTWLTGWDTLHPEFNFPLNLSRVLLGVWRSDQGLGTVAVHAHMVELPRILILWVMSWVFPVHLLRYLYISLCLILGPLGIYVLSFHILLKSHFNRTTAQLASFTAALWYIFNLGTLQQFVLPFEMFPTNYAANGWLFYTAIKCLESKKSLNYLWLGLVNFFASSLAYSFISWYVYYAALGLFLFTTYLVARKSTFAVSLKSIFSILLTVLLINLYWLLPNFYFVINHSWHIPLAKNNQIISDEIFYHNKAYATLADTISMKNHLFNWKIKDGDGFKPLLANYQNFLNSWVIYIPYFFFLVIILGSISSLSSTRQKIKKNIYGIGFIPVLAAAFIAFLTLNPPLEAPFDFLRDHISIVREGLRNPFIKFNILLMLGYAIFCGLGIAYVLTYFGKLKPLKNIKVLFLGITWIALLTLGLPFFQGNLIDKHVQLSIPSEYFQMFSWFNQQSDAGRVLVLPAPDFWAWDYHSWGYQGAGWMWFGIKQPFLSRDSDRWNPYNEESYREISQAVKTRQWSAIHQLLEKYQIKWIIFDQTVLRNDGTKDQETIEQLVKYFTDNDQYQATKFSNQLIVLNVKSVDDSNFGLNKTDQYENVKPDYFWHNTDQAFQQLGNYTSTKLEKQDEYIYPFRKILNQNNRIDSDTISWDKNNIYLKLPEESAKYAFKISPTQDITASISYLQNNPTQGVLKIRLLLPDSPELEGLSTQQILLPTKINQTYYLAINKQIFTILPTNDEQQLGKLSLNINSQNQVQLFDPLEDTSNNYDLAKVGQTTNCGENQTGNVTEKNNQDDSFTLSAQNATACYFLPIIKNKTTSKTDSEQPSQLVIVNFDPLSDSIKKFDFCLLDNNANSCLNPNTELDVKNTSAQVAVLLDDEKIKNLETKMLLFSFVSQNRQEQESLTLKNIDLSLFNSIYSSDFQLPPLNEYYDLSNNEVNNEKITLPLSDAITSLKTSTNSYPALTCGSGSTAILNREIKKEDKDLFVQYSAQKGQTCDGFNFKKLNQKNGYILNVTARNQNGLPLRMCIKSLPQEQCDFYAALGNQKVFVTESFLLPPLGDGLGYNVSFTNFAPGNFASINDLISIEFVPFNYDLLDSIVSQKINSQDTKNQTLIISNQSFEPNMKLFWLKGNHLVNLDKHVKVNNWTNGWIVDKAEIQAKEQAGYKLFLFFLPNLLEIAGLIIGGFCLLFFTIKSIIERKK